MRWALWIGISALILLTIPSSAYQVLDLRAYLVEEIPPGAVEAGWMRWDPDRFVFAGGGSRGVVLHLGQMEIPGWVELGICGREYDASISASTDAATWRRVWSAKDFCGRIRLDLPGYESNVWIKLDYWGRRGDSWGSLQYLASSSLLIPPKTLLPVICNYVYPESGVAPGGMGWARVVVCKRWPLTGKVSLRLVDRDTGAMISAREFDCLSEHYSFCNSKPLARPGYAWVMPVAEDIWFSMPNTTINLSIEVSEAGVVTDRRFLSVSPRAISPEQFGWDAETYSAKLADLSRISGVKIETLIERGDFIREALTAAGIPPARIADPWMAKKVREAVFAGIDLFGAAIPVEITPDQVVEYADFLANLTGVPAESIARKAESIARELKLANITKPALRAPTPQQMEVMRQIVLRLVQFRVWGLSFPEMVPVDTTFMVCVNATNVGALEANYTASFFLQDRLYARIVSPILSPNQSATICTYMMISIPGDYTVGADELRGVVKVVSLAPSIRVTHIFCPARVESEQEFVITGVLYNFGTLPGKVGYYLNETKVGETPTMKAFEQWSFAMLQRAPKVEKAITVNYTLTTDHDPVGKACIVYVFPPPPPPIPLWMLAAILAGGLALGAVAGAAIRRRS